MAKQPLYNTAGQQVGEVELAASLFEAEPNRAVVHQAVVAHLAAARAGTASAKTRAEVRGGGRKPWRQKGTGRARHGSRRSPIWVGGGQIFPPKPRSFGGRLPRKMQRLAFAAALSDAAGSGRVKFVDQIALDDGRTRTLKAVLENLGIAQGVLLVAAEIDAHLDRAAGNLPGVILITADALSTYDILAHETILMTRDALAKLEERRA